MVFYALLEVMVFVKHELQTHQHFTGCESCFGEDLERNNMSSCTVCETFGGPKFKSKQLRTYTHTHVTCADGQNNQMPLRAEGCLTRHHTHARARTTKAHARTCLNLHAYKGTRTYMSKCVLCRAYFVAVCYVKVSAATAALFCSR